MTISRAPKGLKSAGSRLWRTVSNEFELEQHEMAVLLQACRISDTLDRLQASIDDGEVIVSSPQGTRANPAVVEFRQQALTLAKCMAALRIPVETDDQRDRAQTRVRR
jgi:hypothetical protein